jgi:hypothetical protein
MSIYANKFKEFSGKAADLVPVGKRGERGTILQIVEEFYLLLSLFIIGKTSNFVPEVRFEI